MQVPVPEKKCPKCSHTTANPAQMTQHIKTAHGLPTARGAGRPAGNHACPHCPHLANTRIDTQTNLNLSCSLDFAISC